MSTLMTPTEQIADLELRLEMKRHQNQILAQDLVRTKDALEQSNAKLQLVTNAFKKLRKGLDI